MRSATVRLKRKSDGREIIVDQRAYATDLGRWRAWRLVGTTHGEADGILPTVGGRADGAEAIDYAGLRWFALKSATHKATGRTPNTKADAIAALRGAGLWNGD
ncbi:MAG: hypothetical protein ACPGO3_09985 [Magnetospiraceae bacterium]